VIILVITASLAYVFMKRDESNPAFPRATSQNEATQPPESSQQSPTQTIAEGAYVDYSAELVASTQGTRLLFFYAPWCPQCRALDASIQESEIPSGVTIFKLDYDSNQALRAKYGVTIQTTVVKVDDADNKVASYVAYDDPTFWNVKQALLP
jgi:thiol-disulfide isomerase/thioredoxin